jgi:NADPH:quinone reductase-like Zn-dependent oxidoreductase
MRAAYVTEPGPADSIRLGSLPVPVPAPDEVLVAVELVSLNRVDTLVRSGGYATPLPRPFVIGRDLVGTVARSGVAARFEPGERVWCNSLGHEGRHGSYSEFALVSAERLYRLPDGVDPAVAVAVAHPAATAYLGWFVHARLRPGETAYVGGSAGNVGTAAVTLARSGGARVIGSARRDDHERVLGAGATAVFDYRDPDLASRVRAVAPNGVDVYWETSGRHDFAVAAATIAAGGRVLLSAVTGEPDPPLPVGPLYTRDVSLLGFVISRASVSDLARAAELVNELLVAGRLTARITEVLPLSAAAEAHRRMEAGEVEGRILLDPRRP